MSDEFNPPTTSNEPDTNAVVSAQAPQRTSFPPVLTTLVIIASTAICVAVHAKNDKLDWATYASLGYVPANEIWNGAIWALVTSTFVHVEAWHLIANLYWLWVLGSRLERAIGSVRYLLFYVAAAFVSSAIQMAASDTTGIGASGVVYAMFGFMWATRSRYPTFCDAVNNKTIQLFVVWLFACFVVTYLKMMAIGNAAHLSGLVFGASVAGAFVLRDKWRPNLLGSIGLVALAALSIVPLLWCPGSVTWLSVQAYRAHEAKRYEEALGWYTQIIQRDPNNAWAYANRGGANHALGRLRAANADFRVARELDPSLFPEPQPESVDLSD